ncbi:MAG: FKBP-type peptidyl-prolyl cis-trans isomerase [Sphingobacteriales bacterium]|nr:FKBP-type peptidyl-prolyl cis-trans isomerase [Sphingobacteriales bacterium]
MKKIAFIVLTLVATFIACKTDGGGSGKQKAANGVEYTIFTSQGGRKPQFNDFIYVFMKYTTPADSVIFNSFTRSSPMAFKLTDKLFRGAMNEALMNMGAGDSALLLVPAELIFGDKRLPVTLKTGDKLKYTIKLVDVKSESEYRDAQTEKMRQATIPKDPELVKKETETIANYAGNRGLTMQKTQRGVFYNISNEGSGNKPKDGEEVYVNYRGTLLDGTEFDSSHKRNEPFKFILGKNMVIPGWEDAIPLMGKGGRGTFIIPSHLAYGAMARPGIPANSVLVFDIELLDIKKAAQ